MTLPAMIFAAGKGTRMRPLTERTPKPLVTVGNTTLLDHALEQVRRAGLPRAVINTHYLADQIAAHAASISNPEIAISFEPDLLETGGGIRAAAHLLGTQPIMTLNADTVWQGESPAAVLRAAWQADRMKALLLLIPRDRAEGHTGPGDFDLDADGRLRRRRGETAGYIYAGAQILHPQPVYDHDEHAFSLNVIWDEMIAAGSLYGTPYPGNWCDVGRPENIPLAERLL
ncbi:nucleotidyltransferase family protein [Algicella marina]|uniref:NTP transferase domain-containing protein n=1 Tax=Algicella marina TaxID=2683284 RepID=A0A6P1T2G8_9RHOB|nr:nucleotidyltransferase family protein [Algicella marina]QHQ35990.1 NTP transferase domain-containing protein [Algicella marina]